MLVRYKTPSNDDQFLLEVQAEVAHARAKHPSNRHILAALVEEIGEAAQALIDHDTGHDNVLPADIYKELVQVATMALRVAVDTDPSFRYRGRDADYSGIGQVDAANEMTS